MEELITLGFTIKEASNGYLNLGDQKWTEFFIYPDNQMEVYFHLCPGGEPVEQIMTIEEYITTVKILLR